MFFFFSLFSSTKSENMRQNRFFLGKGGVVVPVEEGKWWATEVGR
jgi:hypothetical protein